MRVTTGGQVAARLLAQGARGSGTVAGARGGGKELRRWGARARLSTGLRTGGGLLPWKARMGREGAAGLDLPGRPCPAAREGHYRPLVVPGCRWLEQGGSGRGWMRGAEPDLVLRFRRRGG